MCLEKYTAKFQELSTPFYFYDVQLLTDTINTLKQASDKYKYHIHYSLKANSNPKILELLKDNGFGADCVSGNEIKLAINTGFSKDSIVFAGVGKTDAEIEIALQNDIFCFNCESMDEIFVINELALKNNKIASIALRINPAVDAHTHKHINTGVHTSKFGIEKEDISMACDNIKLLNNINLIGLHVHIGSQITDMKVYEEMCWVINDINRWFRSNDIMLEHLNVGGGLGIDYRNPDNSIPDFESYFETINKNLVVYNGQEVHFELGRSVVGQCGNLITKVLYVKENTNVRFAIVDAGFTELIRPALYNAYHKIENLSSTDEHKVYDVVGPICESSDFMGKEVSLPKVTRGDLLVIRSAGAYGQVMSSNYNARELVNTYYSDQLIKE